MDPKSDLHRYLQAAREDLLWKLEDLSEYDVRRPLTPTGTNLLGLVKHLAAVEFLYFGLVFDRPVEDPPEWLLRQDDEVNGDFWATADETREYILDLYRRAAVHADATIAALDLDAVGFVPWFSPAMQRLSLHAVLVHVVAECHRHVGHADIVRELIDGTAGLSRDEPFLPSEDPAWWDEYRARVSDAATAQMVDGGEAARVSDATAAQMNGGASPQAIGPAAPQVNGAAAAQVSGTAPQASGGGEAARASDATAAQVNGGAAPRATGPGAAQVDGGAAARATGPAVAQVNNVASAEVSGGAAPRATGPGVAQVDGVAAAQVSGGGAQVVDA